jgi:hypothetical protein
MYNQNSKEKKNQEQGEGEETSPSIKANALSIDMTCRKYSLEMGMW